MSKLAKGYVQVYTGDGKGKTTAALGQGFRAVGNGLKVYMVQFLKTFKTGELQSVKRLDPDFKIFRFEKKRGFFWTLNDLEKAELKIEIAKAYKFCYDSLEKCQCDVLIMDEVMGALSNKLLDVEQVIKLIHIKPDNVELILTGRNVPEQIVKEVDLITEMKAIKHYFTSGVPAREGIEY